MSQFPNSEPGIGSSLKLIARVLFIMDTQTTMDFLPGGRQIDGSATRDPDNTIRTDEIRAGLVLGVVTGSANTTATTPTIGLYGASIIGTLTAAVSGTTSTTLVTTAVACAELTRRIGASGTLVLTGASSSTGTVAAQVFAYNSISKGTTTGSVTLSAAVGVAATLAIAGSWIGAYDGTATPVSILAGDLYPIRVTDINGTDQITPWRLVPITTKPYRTANIVNYPPAAYTSLATYLKTKLRVAVAGATFDDDLP